MDINKIDIAKLQELYLDYLNNFLTKQAFADYYGFTDEQANIIITCGSNVHLAYYNFVVHSKGK